MLFKGLQLGRKLGICAASAGALIFGIGCLRSHPRTVAVIPETTAEELWEAEHAGAASAALGTNWDIYWNGPSREDDVTRQIELVEAAIEKRDGGIILSPDHAIALNTLVRRAVARDIPTVIVGAPLSIPPNRKLAYILNDDEGAGRLAADRVGENLNGKGTVALIETDPGIAATGLRANAFKNRLATLYPAVRMISGRSGSGTFGQDLLGLQQILERYPQLDAVVALDIIATRASFSTLKSQHKSKQVKLIACDQDLDFLYYLRKGEIDSIVVENTFEMGYRAMKLVDAGARGESITGSVLLEPILVTRANVDLPEVQRMLSMDWRPAK